MSEPIRVYFADDLANVRSLETSIVQAFNRIDPVVSVVYESEDRIDRAEQYLGDLGRPLDLILIDVMWVEDAMPQDLARELLPIALARRDAAVVVISHEIDPLVKYLYDPQHSDRRPHAVVDKNNSRVPSVLAGVIESAFSAARLPLRSRSMNFRWRLDELDGRSPAIDPQIAEELVAVALGDVHRVEITPISGGLSGAITLLARGQIARGAGQPDERRRVLVKAAQDARALAAEQEAYDKLVPPFPANLFSRLSGRRPFIQFAGWSALVVEEIDGRTAARCSVEDVLSSWNRIFPKALWDEQARSAVDEHATPMEALVATGVLSSDRLNRAADAAQSLAGDTYSELCEALRAGGSNLWESHSQSIQWYVTGHRDLHTSNVLIGAEGQVTWIDPGSMESRGAIWCADLARFAVWFVLPLCVEAKVTPERLVAVLVSDVLTDSGSSQGDIASAATVAIAASIAAAATSWEGVGKAAPNASCDWPAAVAAELVRAVYSVDLLSVECRVLAASGAWVLASRH